MNRLLLTGILVLYGCGNNTQQSDTIALAKTPVTLTSLSVGDMHTEHIFNAYSKYLRKEPVHSPIAGYIRKVTISPGVHVTRGQILFELQTPESKALTDSNLALDSLDGIRGILNVRATKNGIINDVLYHEGAFVQQGEPLTDIIETVSIAFIMNVPYETTSAISKGQAVEIQIPGEHHVHAHVGNPLPTSNPSEQVVSYIVKPDSLFFIPEGLNALITVQTDKRMHVPRLDKQAVLTNETQTHFWVMKLLNDSTAIKIDIEKGQEASNWIEVKSPAFSPEDKILLTGQYGLPDTAYVEVVKR